MRPALLLPVLLATATLTGCAASAGGAPTETVTVTATPSASPSPTEPTKDELEAWAEEIEAGLIELNGSWKQQCENGDDWACYVTDFKSDSESIVEITLDVTEDKVPGLEYELEKYKNLIGDLGGRQIHRDVMLEGVAHPWPDYIRFVNPDGTQIGYTNATDAPLYRWATLYPDYG